MAGSVTVAERLVNHDAFVAVNVGDFTVHSA